ncbi:helix-turn-helix domain-containing protein [uncultured Thiohalocapsa sp.]|uniref:helix-turn-helix transcriptional regulator n=1 Tax=uncultured Thiohalocapsa sp. TaxID=768990 RepID=UPI0025E4C480|nr:helix-turn-helix domain-containing protein [uncultured Thiohalocapsa sp.]
MTTRPETNPAPRALTSALLDEKAAAALLSFSPRTLQMWRVRGGGPKYLKLGSAVRYHPDDLATWIEEQTRSNTTGPAAA